MIAQLHTEASRRPTITTFTTMCACRNNVTSEISPAVGTVRTAWVTPSVGMSDRTPRCRARPPTNGERLCGRFGCYQSLEGLAGYPGAGCVASKFVKTRASANGFEPTNPWLFYG